MNSFPIDLIPSSIKDAIIAQSAMGGFSHDAVGPAALAVVCHATQGLANVDALHTPGVSFPLSNLFMILQRSGDAKSSVFNGLTRGINTWQDRQYEIFQHQMVAYQADKKIFEFERVKAEKAGNRDDLVRIMEQAPPLPCDPRNIITKSTTNGIYSTLERGWPTVGIFTSEGGSMLSGHSLRKENSPAEFASMMTLLWDGAPIDRTTGEVTLRLRGRRMSGLLLVQPEVASAFLNDPILKTQGLHARFLIASPPPWVPKEVNFTSPEEADRLARLKAHLEPFAERVDELLSSPMYTGGDDARELNPMTIGWDMEAREHLGTWYNTVALKWRKEETETFFGRALEHAQRLAGAMTVFHHWHTIGSEIAPYTSLDPRPLFAAPQPYIGIDIARAATALVEWFAGQLLAIDVPVTDERDTRQSGHIDRILKFMRKTGKPHTARDLARGPMQRVDARIRDAILEAMVQDEHLDAFETVNGTSKTISYKLK